MASPVSITEEVLQQCEEMELGVLLGVVRRREALAGLQLPQQQQLRLPVLWWLLFSFRCRSLFFQFTEEVNRYERKR